MKLTNIFLLLPCILLLVLSNGCAAPGSALGRVGLSGMVTGIENPNDLRVRAVLPEVYGLGGLDRLFGKPSDYGNADLFGGSAIDSKGEFSIIFDPLVYHAAFWLLPPLGFQPKYPPDPYFAIQFSNAPDQIYIVQKRWGKIQYEVWSLPDKKELQRENAFWRIVNGSIEETEFDFKERKINGKIMRIEVSNQKSIESSQHTKN